MSKKLNQAGKPNGLIGRLLGKIMGKMNQPDNIWTVGLLEISGAEKILEVGYGPGQAIQYLSEACPDCYIDGIDHSDEMLNSATRTNQDGIARGKVRLAIGDVAQLDFTDGSFDKAFSINCIYFWENPLAGLQELYRVLKSGGKLAITVRERKREAYKPFQPDIIENLMKHAGFSITRVYHNGSSSHPLCCILGIK